ncbi:MAG: polyribonucleotide nucleotidyltransferase, partial [Victivallaceae bacterium]
IDGQLVANPSVEQMKRSTIDLIYAGLPDKVIMIEREAEECSEDELAQAMYFANEIVKEQCKAQLDLASRGGKAKKDPVLHLVPEAMMTTLREQVYAKLEVASIIPGKQERGEALDLILSEAKVAMREQFSDMSGDDFNLEMNKGFDDLVREAIRKAIIEKQYRPDGRAIDQLRPLSAEVGVLPVVHGSALFSRGETQALVIATLGNEKDAQESDNITGDGSSNVKRFYLHYNFPNYSVGEVGRISGPGRREIGHGDLAERSVSKVVPKDFPYVVRCVSEIMSSNGSTSMASVCGATLALMDAGVPIKSPVVGISCGLVTEGDKELLLTDIIGAEDHFGDMDFKVCGTSDGITGFQLDLKLPGIKIDLLCEAMVRNHTAREQIMKVVTDCIAAPRAEISERAPRIQVVKINPEKIGALIGPGGKNIKAITEETQANIDINDSGEVKIMAADKKHLDMAIERVLGCTAQAEIGKIYRG